LRREKVKANNENLRGFEKVQNSDRPSAFIA
jgi:hypothetical protein